MKRRIAKQRVFRLLSSPDFDVELAGLAQDCDHQVITSLLSCISKPDDLFRWRAIIALGATVAACVQHDLETGRRIMRRLIWSLNDESGSIGWGAPEAMAEIMAGSEQLAREYVHILISYISEEINFLEEARLQQGVLWGLGRLAQVHSELVRDAIPFVKPYVKSSHAQCRAMAAWVLGMLRVNEVRNELEALVKDREQVLFWRFDALVRVAVGEVAKDALTKIAQRFEIC